MCLRARHVEVVLEIRRQPIGKGWDTGPNHKGVDEAMTPVFSEDVRTVVNEVPAMLVNKLGRFMKPARCSKHRRPARPGS